MGEGKGVFFAVFFLLSYVTDSTSYTYNTVKKVRYSVNLDIKSGE